MLKEFEGVRQVQGEPRRRWFEDDYFDLIVWFEPGEEVWGFQLCYDRQRKPRALTWTRTHGYKHSGIDSGENNFGGNKEAPVLVEDGLFEARTIAGRFADAAAAMPEPLREFVRKKLEDYKI